MFACPRMQKKDFQMYENWKFKIRDVLLVVQCIIIAVVRKVTVSFISLIFVKVKFKRVFFWPNSNHILWIFPLLTDRLHIFFCKIAECFVFEVVWLKQRKSNYSDCPLQMFTTYCFENLHQKKSVLVQVQIGTEF